MKFSILIPVYNVERYIADCLDSVINQKFSDYEIIIVDDGSTDESGKICDRYQQAFSNRVKVIHKANQGLISARRIGVELAAGEYCVFVDSDDYVSLDLLPSIEQALREHQDPDIVMYTYQYVRQGKITNQYPHLFEDGCEWSGEEKKELYLKLIAGSSIDALFIKAVKTKLLKSDPTPYESFYNRNMSEDTFQTIYPLTVAQHIVYIDRPLYLYRVQGNSISHNYSLANVKKNNSIHVYYAIRSMLPVWDLDDDQTLMKLDARWFNETMYQFCKCYESADSGAERSHILRYDWSSLLPAEVSGDHPYVSREYYRVYQWLQAGQVSLISLWFLKKKLYGQYKKLKSKRD